MGELKHTKEIMAGTKDPRSGIPHTIEEAGEMAAVLLREHHLVRIGFPLFHDAGGLEPDQTASSLSVAEITPPHQIAWRSIGERPLEVLGVTMPPWPGAEEGYRVEGVWKTTLDG